MSYNMFQGNQKKKEIEEKARELFGCNSRENLFSQLNNALYDKQFIIKCYTLWQYYSDKTFFEKIDTFTLVIKLDDFFCVPELQRAIGREIICRFIAGPNAQKNANQEDLKTVFNGKFAISFSAEDYVNFLKIKSDNYFHIENPATSHIIKDERIEKIFEFAAAAVNTQAHNTILQTLEKINTINATIIPALFSYSVSCLGNDADDRTKERAKKFCDYLLNSPILVKRIQFDNTFWSLLSKLLKSHKQNEALREFTIKFLSQTSFLEGISTSYQAVGQSKKNSKQDGLIENLKEIPKDYFTLAILESLRQKLLSGSDLDEIQKLATALIDEISDQKNQSDLASIFWHKRNITAPSLSKGELKNITRSLKIISMTDIISSKKYFEEFEDDLKNRVLDVLDPLLFKPTLSINEQTRDFFNDETVKYSLINYFKTYYKELTTKNLAFFFDEAYLIYHITNFDTKQEGITKPGNTKISKALLDHFDIRNFLPLLKKDNSKEINEVFKNCYNVHEAEFLIERNNVTDENLQELLQCYQNSKNNEDKNKRALIVINFLFSNPENTAYLEKILYNKNIDLLFSQVLKDASTLNYIIKTTFLSQNVSLFIRLLDFLKDKNIHPEINGVAKNLYDYQRPSPEYISQLKTEILKSFAREAKNILEYLSITFALPSIVVSDDNSLDMKSEVHTELSGKMDELRSTTTKISAQLTNIRLSLVKLSFRLNSFENFLISFQNISSNISEWINESIHNDPEFKDSLQRFFADNPNSITKLLQALADHIKSDNIKVQIQNFISFLPLLNPEQLLKEFLEFIDSHYGEKPESSYSQLINFKIANDSDISSSVINFLHTKFQINAIIILRIKKQLLSKTKVLSKSEKINTNFLSSMSTKNDGKLLVAFYQSLNKNFELIIQYFLHRDANSLNKILCSDMAKEWNILQNKVQSILLADLQKITKKVATNWYELDEKPELYNFVRFILCAMLTSDLKSVDFSEFSPQELNALYHYHEPKEGFKSVFVILIENIFESNPNIFQDQNAFSTDFLDYLMKSLVYSSCRKINIPLFSALVSCPYFTIDKKYFNERRDSIEPAIFQFLIKNLSTSFKENQTAEQTKEIREKMFRFAKALGKKFFVDAVKQLLETSVKPHELATQLEKELFDVPEGNRSYFAQLMWTKRDGVFAPSRTGGNLKDLDKIIEKFKLNNNSNSNANSIPNSNYSKFEDFSLHFFLAEPNINWKLLSYVEKKNWDELLDKLNDSSFNIDKEFIQDHKKEFQVEHFIVFLMTQLSSSYLANNKPLISDEGRKKLFIIAQNLEKKTFVEFIKNKTNIREINSGDTIDKIQDLKNKLYQEVFKTDTKERSYFAQIMWQQHGLKKPSIESGNLKDLYEILAPSKVSKVAETKKPQELGGSALEYKNNNL